MFAGLGMTEILLIVVLLLILFGGGKKFAEMGKGLGEGIRNFRSSVKGDPPADQAPKDEKK